MGVGWGKQGEDHQHISWRKNGKGEEKESRASALMCLGGRRGRMECLSCWGLVSVCGKGEHFPGVSFHSVPVQPFFPGIVSWNRNVISCVH